MTKRCEMSSKVITKNILSSYLAKGWLGIVTILCIPYILKELGTDAYGLFSLSIIIVGYSILLDFGLGRGVVKYIAEYNVLGDAKKIKKLVRSSFTLYFAAGFLGAIILALFAKILLNKVFKIPCLLHYDALIVFYLTACALFFRLPQTLFQSVAIGYQKIYLLNIINAVFNTLKVASVVVLLYLGYFLIAVVAANVLIGIVHLAALYLFSRKILPDKNIGFGFDLDIIKKVLRFSVKTFAADSLGMLITYVDKIMISIFLPIANLAIYAVPFELTSRIWSFQVAAVSFTLPNFSEYSAANVKEKFNQLYIRLTKFIVIFAAFLSGIIFFFAKQILTYWISPDFALKGQFILKIASWGILTSSILSIAGIVSYGANRLAMPIKINLAMLFLHICLCIIFILLFGINGVVLSWITAHFFGIGIMVPWINKEIIKIKNIRYFSEILKPIVLGVIVSGLTFIMSINYIHGLMGLFIAILLSGIVYIILTYIVILKKDERRFILRLIPAFSNRF